MKLKGLFVTVMFLLVFTACRKESGFVLNRQEYFEKGGVNVMAFQDIYPEGHQGGVAVIMHGKRLATNGDIRLDETPGQWQPIPKQYSRKVDSVNNAITVRMGYPDSAINRKGFNPIEYPDLIMNYTVNVRADGESVVVTVDLDNPVPEEFIGKVGFNMELFPGWLFGKPWIMDSKSGIFPRQANGPAMIDKKGDIVAAMPMATGRKLVVSPDNDTMRMSVESSTSDLQLLDGRYVHNNGWFVVRSLVPAGASAKAIEWRITPNSIDGWKAEPVVHVSQVGYRPEQQKTAIIELDKYDSSRKPVKLYRITATGEDEEIAPEGSKTEEWGSFLRYNYLRYDFSKATGEGLYFVSYGDQKSQPFRIAADVYKRNVWQPTVEFFLPVMMCHMRINEKYRVWHGLCHMDDALMAPINHNHFDGYMQGPSTLTRYKPGDHVPGLDVGGWHDAGDYDLRVESQSGETYILSMAYEEFKPQIDETSIDQDTRIVEIHQPDGKDDILQQIEHGALTVTAGYENLGRLYRGIIEAQKRQYILLGDGSTMTDGLIYTKNMKPGERTGTASAVNDDRWVFTEDNPYRELTVAAHLAACARVLKDFNPSLSSKCLKIAEALFSGTKAEGWAVTAGLHAASELLMTTGNEKYRTFILNNSEALMKGFEQVGWLVGRSLPAINDHSFTAAMTEAAKAVSDKIASESEETPFGVPYRPKIWGAGWDIQGFGVRQYFLHKEFPDVFSSGPMFNALNFVLGVHPGTNTSSFASGVGVRSSTIAYGINRADESYIPGGVVSGTALIRPDFPELLDWPYLWQQQEYVMGGGATDYMFLVLAADNLLEKNLQ